MEWALKLDTPQKDSLDRWCSNEIVDIVRKLKDSLNGCDLYYLKGSLYTGWACEVIPDNVHKYRYEQFENGKMIRRIAYYDNGQLDADFRMKNCKNFGPSRMWMRDGKMYIDNYYISPGIMHGFQKRWYDNGVLAKESNFDAGKLIYEKAYDRNGVLVTE